MNKLLKHALSLNQLRKTVGVARLRGSMKIDFRFKILKDPPGDKILVLSPHPDDDAFALGGTLSKYTKAKKYVSVLYLSEGLHGTKDGSLNPDLKEIRQKEARCAAEILGIKDIRFWEESSEEIKKDKEAKQHLKELILELNCDTIYVPSPFDNHLTHRRTAEILADTIAKNVNLPIKIVMGYEVWSPTFANRIIDINDTVEQKKKAMACHKSQLACREFDKAILGLNQYRAEINGISGYAEGFLQTAPDTFAKLFEIANR
jgi:LmbE family N-acetylglucosaminyl deacetylase